MSDKYMVDRNLIEIDNGVIEFNNLKELPDGRFTIMYDEVRFDAFFHRKKEKKLYVLFSGSRANNGKIGKIPHFPRWSWYPYFDGSVLFFEDPMYYEYENLKLGWFYGNKEKNYRDIMAIILNRILKILGVSNSELVFYSSSGGGNIAINMAALFEKSMAVTINAQFRIDNYKYLSKDFYKQTNIKLELSDKSHRVDVTYFIKNYNNSSYFIICNVLSDEDAKQMEYLCKQLNINPSLGINQYGNIIIWLYEAQRKNPHTAQEDTSMLCAIENLIEKYRNGVNLQDYNDIVLLYNNFWRDMWEQKNEIDLLKHAEKIKGKFYCCETREEDDLLNNMKICLKNSSTNYVFKNIYAKFEENSVYKLVLGHMESENADIDEITIAVFDESNRKFVVRKEIFLKDNRSFLFMTGNNVENVKLRLYAGIAGKTKGNSVIFENVQLFKLTTRK